MPGSRVAMRMARAYELSNPASVALVCVFSTYDPCQPYLNNLFDRVPLWCR